MPKTHSGGPGTYTERGVRCTMDAPFNKASVSGSGGIMDRNKAPFDKPHDTGNGGIPLKFFDATSAKPATTVNAGMGAPSSHGQQNVGTRRFKNPK